MSLNSVEQERTSEFSVTYEGEALTNNLMDVKDFAPAVLSLGQAFERANSVLNGSKATVGLHIEALSPGSFGVSLVLNQILQGASAAISFDWLTSANNLTALLIGTPTGILSLLLLIKELKGKKPKQTESTDAVVFEAENVTLTVPKDIARLYNDKPTRDQNDVVRDPKLPDVDYKVALFRRQSVKSGNPVFDARLTPVEVKAE